MKATKAELVRALEAVQAFQRLRIVAVPPDKVEGYKTWGGFVPISNYPGWQVPVHGEFGRCNKVRYRVMSRPDDQRKVSAWKQFTEDFPELAVAVDARIKAEVARATKRPAKRK